MLLDASALHAGRTGREILTIAQQFMGLPPHRLGEMLETPSASRGRTGPQAGTQPGQRGATCRL